MLIHFSTKKLHKACNSSTEAIRTFGPERGKKLMQRLSELAAANTLNDISRLPPARCHELTGDRQGPLSVDLGHPYRLLFVPAHDPIPKKAAGGLDWSAVTEIEVIEVADTH